MIIPTGSGTRRLQFIREGREKTANSFACRLLYRSRNLTCFMQIVEQKLEEKT